MVERKMGKWANPPLAYVVAEAAISPHYSIAQSIPAIQQALRGIYPRTIDGMEIAIELAGSQQSPVPHGMWQLLTADNTRGIHIGTRAIALHATHYVDFPTFNEWLSVLLGAIEASGLSPFVEKLGLRYIDYILPSRGHEARDYVVRELRGVTPDGTVPTTNMWVGTFPYSNCTVTARVAAPPPPGTLLPPNFNALPLAKPKTMLEAEERMKGNAAFGFIDTDCTQPLGQVFSASAIASKFENMHDHISTTFKAIMSPLAEKEWV